MKWVLPPKRFESPDSTKYDPIRPRTWFKKIHINARKLPRYDKAFRLVEEGGYSRRVASIEAKARLRDFNDYYWFRKGYSPRNQPDSYQHIMDRAYLLYCADSARFHISRYIGMEAPRWGEKPLRVAEHWEIDPTLYPNDYPFL